jgi:Na+/proline symporter
VTDFHRRLWPHHSDRAYLRLAQWITAIVGVLGTAAACLLAAANVASLWDSFLTILGLFGAGLAGLFALGIFTRRASGAGALVGAIASGGLLYGVQQYTSTSFFLYGLIGVGTCFIVGYLASLVLPSKPKDLRQLTLYTKTG